MIQYPWEFVNAVRDFYLVLRELHQKDQEQEIQGAAIVTYNQILEDAKAMLSGNPMIQAFPEVITSENIENEIYPRVADTMIVISQIWSALGTGRSLP
jgi:phytoene/squalene synthetase